MTPRFAQLLSALDHALGTVGSIFLWLAAISTILFIIALLCAAYLPSVKHRRRRSFTDMRYFAPLLLAGVVGLMAGCSTTQESKINSAAASIAAGAATLQTDLSKYGPIVASEAGSAPGSNSKVTAQISAVNADAAAYASDAQLLAQIVAAITAAPATSGTNAGTP
jgi:ABC-type molybdate transport system permease subunit